MAKPLKPPKPPKQPKWYEDVKQHLCVTCTKRLRGCVDVPGRYCKHMAKIKHARRPIVCDEYKAVQS